MNKLLIDVGKHTTQIFKDILHDTNYDSKSFNIALEEQYIIINIIDNKHLCSIINYISNKIANYIVNFIEPKIVREEVELMCLDLFDSEIEEDIAEKTEWLTLQKDQEDRKRYLLQLRDSIFNGLKNQGLFNLLGFINFRLKDRRLEIKENVNIALEDYFNDEQDEQFVSLIKKIVSIQKIQTELIHVIMISNNKYEMITGNNEKVDIDDIRKVLDEITNKNNDTIEQFHLVLSVLMVLIPKDIVIHASEQYDPYITQMLKKIYEDRVNICNDCKLCQKTRINKNKK